MKTAISFRHISPLGFFVAFFLIISVFTGKTHALDGSQFNPGRIIDDSVFFNNMSMDASQIQAFLNSKVPNCDTNGDKQYYSTGMTRSQWAQANGQPLPPYTCLKDYSQSVPAVTNGGSDLCKQSISGGTKSAASIIYDVAQACGINPQVLIVLLQKEQSLITDDWPWPVQYQKATGYGCPDTAPCDTQYYGFFNQVYQAAKAFQRYSANPDSYNYKANRNNFIYYNPNLGGCGGSNVFIENQATVNLYIYTPYQPNQAALNNLYGTGDDCSAYGNRNFWRMFSDWFGSTQDTSFQLVVTDDGSLTQYVIYNHMKQKIPSPAVKIAWGLDRVNVSSVSQAYLNTLVDGPNLDILMRVNGGQHVYLLDRGFRYLMSSPNQMQLWNVSSRTISNVVTGLGAVPYDGGGLSNIVAINSSATKYLVDGPSGGNTQFIAFSNTTVKNAWSNSSVTDISNDLYSLINGTVAASQISGLKINNSGKEYLVVSNQKMHLPFNEANLYPGIATTVSNLTLNSLVSTTPASHLIKSANDTKVYVVFDGKKHHILSPLTLNNWTTNDKGVNIVNDSFISLIPDNSSINVSFVKDSTDTLYLLDNGKTVVPDNLKTAYTNSINPPVQLSNSYLLNIFGTKNKVITNFVKGSSAKIYLLDNSGIRHHVDSVSKAELWDAGKYTTLSDNIVANYTVGATAKTFVNDGLKNYILINGKKSEISSALADEWGLANPQIFNDSTLSLIQDSPITPATSLHTELGYYLIDNDKAYFTTDIKIASLWNIVDSTFIPENVARAYLSKRILTRIARTTDINGSRYYLVNDAKWYLLNTNQKSNLIKSNEPVTDIDISVAAGEVYDWTFNLISNGSGGMYVIDSSKKRGFPNTIVRDHWVNNSNVLTVSQAFLDLLDNGQFMERTIKGSGNEIYLYEANSKRWITNPSTFWSLYAPYTQVSDALLQSVGNGSNIP